MNPELYYWTREKSQSKAEVDFLIQLGNKVLPIEVKSGKTGTLKSLHLYMESKHLHTALRFSTNRPAIEEMNGIAPPGQALDPGGFASAAAPRGGVSRLTFPALTR